MSLVLDKPSKKAPAHPLERVSAAMRHAAIGINCYQHAIGYPHVLVSNVKRTVKRHEAVTMFNYLTIIPGLIQDYQPQNALEKNTADIIQRCAEDGLEYVGQSCPAYRDDERRIGLYMGGPDFHFSSIDKDGNTSHTYPDREVEYLAGIPEKIGSYTLEGFFRGPKVVLPSYVAKRMPDIRYEIIGDDVVSFAVIDNPGLHHGDTIKIREGARTARLMDSCKTVPMPALPNFRLDTKYRCLDA